MKKKYTVSIELDEEDIKRIRKHYHVSEETSTERMLRILLEQACGFT